MRKYRGYWMNRLVVVSSICGVSLFYTSTSFAEERTLYCNQQGWRQWSRAVENYCSTTKNKFCARAVRAFKTCSYEYNGKRFTTNIRIDTNNFDPFSSYLGGITYI